MYILVLALVLLALYLSLNVIHVVVNNYQKHKFFQIKSPRLPVVPKPNILVGNVGQTTWNMKNCVLIDKWHNRLGRTFGFYFMAQPWVSTTDIDLIKKIQIDDASKHLNRSVMDIPCKEFGDSLVQNLEHEWRPVRRALGAALR